ncbi:hypothetical protein PspLS_04576, partial [Pyricularia sp. CBS 133598]
YSQQRIHSRFGLGTDAVRIGQVFPQVSPRERERAKAPPQARLPADRSPLFQPSPPPCIGRARRKRLKIKVCPGGCSRAKQPKQAHISSGLTRRFCCWELNFFDVGKNK